MKRVMIFGASGSGKSTLARKLGEKSGLPVIHIDQIFWKPGWIETPREEVFNAITEKIKADEWVFDGNYSSTYAERMARADTAIFLDISTGLRLWFVLLRIMKSYGRSRPDMAPGCPEKLDWNFLKWVVFYNRRGDREKALQLLKTAPKNVATHHLKSRVEVKKFLSNIQESTNK